MSYVWRAGVCLVLAAAALTLCAGVARADGPTTSITSPSDPSFFYDPTGGSGVNLDNSPIGFTVSGTSTGLAGQAVDIDCYADGGDSGTYEGTLASDVSVAADGSFSASVSYSTMESNGTGDPCQVLAVPTGTTPSTGLASFTGPRVLLAYLETDYEYDAADYYYLYAPQLGGANDYVDAGAGNGNGYAGLYDSYVYDPSVFGQEDGVGFYGNDWLYDNGAEMVDGSAVYPPYTAAGDSESPGDGGLTVSATQNPTNGDITINEIEPLSSWDSDHYEYEDSGVELQRTITQTDGGHVVLVDDHYVSTDQRGHTVTLELDNQQCFTHSGGCDSSALEYQFPGQSGYSTPGSSVTVGSSVPGTIMIENTTPGSPVGAITYFTAPTQFGFADASGALAGSPGDFEAGYTLDVPAGGSTQLEFAYSTDTSQSALAQDVQAALDVQSPPTISISAPAAGLTTSSASVTVTGTASAGSGVKSVTVDGVSAALSGSSFSAVVPLSAGANELTATVTSDAGGTSSASESVAYAVPFSPPATVAAKVSPRGLSLHVRASATHTAHRVAEYHFTASGKLSLPTGVSSASGCTGTVAVRLWRGAKTLLSRRVALGSSCNYSFKAKISVRKLGHGRFDVGAGFGGNSVLTAVAAPTLVGSFKGRPAHLSLMRARARAASSARMG